MGQGRRRERGLHVNAGLRLASDQMMREAEQRVCSRCWGWIGHFRRDCRAAPRNGEHLVEIARPSIETVQLGDEEELFDGIAKLLRELQTSREGGMRLLAAAHCVHGGNAEALLQ